jgi:hypothetical protein
MSSLLCATGKGKLWLASIVETPKGKTQCPKKEIPCTMKITLEGLTVKLVSWSHRSLLYVSHV